MIDEDADRERAVEVLGADESSRHADALESEIRLGEGASRREDEQASREKQRALHTTPSLVSGASADRSATTRTGTPNEGLSAGDAERFTPLRESRSMGPPGLGRGPGPRRAKGQTD